MKWFWIACAAVYRPRVTLSVLITIGLYLVGKLEEYPRGAAVILPGSWIADEFPDPWTRKQLINVPMERIVTFWLWPKHQEIMFDVFVAPRSNKPAGLRATVPVPALAEGACFPVLR